MLKLSGDISMDSKTVKVAVVQAASVLFDKRATIEKTCKLVEDAAIQKSELILFPEAFIPAYPRGLSFGMTVGSRNEAGRSLWETYWENAIGVPGPEVYILGKIAKKAGAYIAIGVIERDGDFSNGTLYCSLLYFSLSL